MNPIIRVSLRYGAIAGIIGAVLLIALYYLGRHPLLIPVYLDFRIILFFVFIFFALREIRDYHFGGILYFWQGVIASFLFTTVFALIASFSILGFVTAVPGFLSEYIDLTLQQMRSLPKEVIESIGEEVYQRNLDLLPATDARMLAFTYFVQSFLISFFISIIISVLLRRQPKN